MYLFIYLCNCLLYCFGLLCDVAMLSLLYVPVLSINKKNIRIKKIIITYFFNQTKSSKRKLIKA